MSGWHNDPIKSTGFDAQIKHEDGYELHFYTDRLEAYRAVEKVCQKQIDRKPKTHADRIRAMTDEELEKYMPSGPCPPNRWHRDGFGARYTECPNEERFHGCRDCWLDWLKQEVSE